MKAWEAMVGVEEVRAWSRVLRKRKERKEGRKKKSESSERKTRPGRRVEKRNENEERRTHLFPAFGAPKNPISANNLNSNSNLTKSGVSPLLAQKCCVFSSYLPNVIFPSPPFPPLTKHTLSSPISLRSKSIGGGGGWGVPWMVVLYF